MHIPNTCILPDKSQWILDRVSTAVAVGDSVLGVIEVWTVLSGSISPVTAFGARLRFPLWQLVLLYWAATTCAHSILICIHYDASLSSENTNSITRMPIAVTRNMIANHCRFVGSISAKPAVPIAIPITSIEAKPLSYRSSKYAYMLKKASELPMASVFS